MTEFVTKRTISFEKSDTGNIKSTSQESHYQFRFTSFRLTSKAVRCRPSLQSSLFHNKNYPINNTLRRTALKRPPVEHNYIILPIEMG